MTKEEIEKIKNNGSRENLIREISNKLFRVRQSLETATNATPQGFNEKTNDGIGLIKDVQQLYEEYIELGKK